MAIPGIAAQVPRQVQQPQQKKDLIDQILRGLQVAQGVTGIAVNTQNFMQQADAAQTKEDIAAGKFESGVQMQAADFVEVPEGTPGATTASIGGEDRWIMKQSILESQASATAKAGTAGETKRKADAEIFDKIFRQKGDVASKFASAGEKLTSNLKEETVSVNLLNDAIEMLNDPKILGNVPMFNAVNTAIQRKLAGGVLSDSEFARSFSQSFGAQGERLFKTKIQDKVSSTDIHNVQGMLRDLIPGVERSANTKIKTAVDRSFANMKDLIPSGGEPLTIEDVRARLGADNIFMKPMELKDKGAAPGQQQAPSKKVQTIQTELDQLDQIIQQKGG